ncbi:MAG: hypothetical protein OQK00_08435 [Rhodobacteraceae bacterium]|nr:hypothetical protein [Paracoccaceae bacterium]MCW9044162.1 hypothetical protein [Pseudopelagicola sp.]
MEKAQVDKKGLIREAYRIEGISAGECRTIFLDWALALEDAANTRHAIQALLDHYGGENGGEAEDHPMTAILREGLIRSETPKRRGGWRSRTRH